MRLPACRACTFVSLYERTPNTGALWAPGCSFGCSNGVFEQVCASLTWGFLPDAAAVLVSSPGGVGTYLELQAVLNQPAGLQQAASAYLVELATVTSLEIEDGEIKVNLVDNGGETIERRFRLKGSNLLEIPE